MQCNVSNTDKSIRYIIAAVAVITGLTLTAGAASYILFAVAGVMVLTSALSFCPIYKVLGVSTCDVQARTDSV